MADRKESARRELARRELNKRKWGEGKNDLMLAGPISRGTEYLRRGISVKDAPYVASKIGSDFLGGIPEMASRKPVISSMAGPFGAVAGADEGVDYFPKPSSEGGRLAGNELGLAAAMLDPGLALSGPIKKAVSAPVQKFGGRLMQGIVKATGEQAPQGAEIAEALLKEGIVGTKQGMLDRLYTLLQEGGKEIGDLIKMKGKGKGIDLDVVFSELNKLRRKYLFAQNTKKVEMIDKLKDMFRPAFKEKKTIKFYKDVGGTFDEFGNYTPEGKFIKQTRSVRRPVPLEEAQARKVSQYQDLAEGRGFPLETTSPEIAGRKAYARGFRKAVEKVIPESKSLNKRFGILSEAAEALEKRLPIEQRQQVFGLGDIIFGAAGTVNPKALTAGVLRKTLQATPVSSRIARAAYRFGRVPPSFSLAYPLSRYLSNE